MAMRGVVGLLCLACALVTVFLAQSALRLQAPLSVRPHVEPQWEHLAAIPRRHLPPGADSEGEREAPRHRVISALAHARTRAALRRIEESGSSRWNQSAATILVLGQKRQRDFFVYHDAFAEHRHWGMVTSPEGFVTVGQVPSFKGSVGVLLCHSLFFSNCIRSPASARTRVDRVGRLLQFWAGGLLRGMKVNRLAAVRQVFTTKDGLCASLQASGLPPDEIWQFAFP